MDVQFQFNLPSNLWEYIPLPNVASPTDHYSLILTVPLPTFVARLLGADTKDVQVEDQYIYETPEHPFVAEAIQHIEEGRVTLSEEGVGGTYFIKDSSGVTVGIFKPLDEEPGAINNPKNLVKTPLLPPGGGYLREVAAYQLDKNHFAGVPETLLLSKVSNAAFATDDVKCGSLQRFVNNTGNCADLGSSGLSVEDVHRIGTLDIRIFNMDRNEENLLTQKREDGSYGLVPIDHTYSLPPITALDNCYFAWQYWPQARKPFSQSTRDYVASIDIESDKQTLRNLGFEEDCISTMVVTTMLLKEAVALDWTLYDIACFIARDFGSVKTPSRLEDFIATCRRVADEGDLPFLDVFRDCLPDLVRSSKQS